MPPRKKKDPNKVVQGLSFNMGAESVVDGLDMFVLSWPPKGAVGARIAIHDRSIGEIFGVVKVLGYVHYKKKGKPEVQGELDHNRLRLSAELAGSDSVVVWHVSEHVKFEQTVPHHGGVNLWKLRSPALEAVNTAVGASSDEIGTDDFDPETGEVYDSSSPDEEVEAVETNIPWKNKKHFPGDVCGVRDCMSTADGYTSIVLKNKLRYRPICDVCSLEHTSHKPTPLQEIARQRNGLADLATVLDSTPENVWGLLDEQGLTERGERRVPPGTAPLELKANPPPDAPSEETAIVSSDDPGVQRATIVADIPKGRLKDVQTEAEEALKQLQGFIIRDQQGMDLANNILQVTKAQYNEIETLRKKTVKPFNDGKKVAQDAFNPALNALSSIEIFLKKCVSEAVRRTHAVQDAALVQVQAAYQQGNMHAAVVATQQAQAAEISLPKGSSIREDFDYIVEDINLIPREFLIDNPATIKPALKAGLVIPGVRKVVRDIMTVKTTS